MLRTFQATGNTWIKVSLKFLLSLCIFRYLNAFESWAWKDCWDAAVGSAGSGHSAGLGWSRPGVQGHRPQCQRLSPWHLCPDFVSVLERVGWEQEDQQGGRALHESSQEVVLLWSELHRDGESCVPPCSCRSQLPCIPPSCVTWPPLGRKCFFQHSVSYETSSFIVPAFAEHLACQMLLQIKEGCEPKFWVQTPSNFGKVCIPVLWLCSIPASFQSYLVTVFIFSSNQKLQEM